MIYDHRRQGHKNLSKDIGHHDVVAVVSHFVLNFLRVNYITYDELKACFIQAVLLHVVLYGLDGTGIEVGAHCRSGPELVGHDRQDS